MFWNGNYTVVREISSLLKDENVTLTQLIEADDILQECNAELKPLVAFLTRPEVVAELVGLITEEPSRSVELQSQYRYAAVAAEILTAGIGALNDRLTSDAAQMHRLCDFLNREPPLNPLLASFFSKTIKCLLEQSPKQDWYTYNIIGLRAMDFLKSRSDFLPNLYRHIGTSAICDLFKYFIRLDLFTKTILEWFEAHQFLEVLVQMICGTYVPEELPAPAPAAAPSPAAAPAPAPPDTPPGTGEKADLPKDVNGENGEQEAADDQDKGSEGADSGAEVSAGSERLSYEVEVKASRIAAGRSAGAASLLCEIVLVGCYGEGCTTRPETGARLMAQCRSEPLVTLLLQSMFTSPAEFRRHALVNGVHVLLQMLQDDPVSSEEANAESRRAVVSAVAPHLPLLHQTLLQEPQPYPYAPQSGPRVGVARLQVATLVAALAGSPAEEVPRALVALGTLPTLLELFFRCPGNNFLHAQTCRAIAAALHNAPFQALYAKHLIIECDLLKRLMDVFEENLEKEGGAPRSGYMGHVILLLELFQQVLDERLYEASGVPDALGVRWAQFKEDKMHPLFQETPLGGYHPAETNFESEPLADDVNYDLSSAGATSGAEDLEAPDDNASDEVFDKYYSTFQYNQEEFEAYTSSERRKVLGAEELRRDLFRNEDKEWDDDYEDIKETTNPKYPGEVLDVVSPWESSSGVGGGGGGGGAGGAGDGAEEGWAQFASAEDNDKFGGFVSARPDAFPAFWDAQPHDHNIGIADGESADGTVTLQQALRELSVGAEGSSAREGPGAAGPAQPGLDNIEATVERQCEPMDLTEDASPEDEALPSPPSSPATAPTPAPADR